MAELKIMEKTAMLEGIPELSAEKPATSEEEENNGRGHWSNRLDYMLSMIGYCVGFGNLWRFPYICQRNGGGAFLVPFFIFLLLGAMPLFFLEAAMSQFSGRGPIGVWSFCPLFKGVGICNVMQLVMYFPYYAILVALPIYYMAQSCRSVLPWTTCGNSWNTELCLEDRTAGNISNITLANMTIPAGGTNLTLMVDSTGAGTAELWRNTSFSHSSLEEFWQYNVLNISGGLDELGSVQWHLVGCLLATYVIIFFSLIKGVKSVGKVVYVTATLPYVLLVIILVRTVTLPGATDGMLYFINPDFSKLLNLQVWLEACLQVFYSLGVGFGMIATASSYNKFHEPCLRDSLILCAVSEGTSVFAGFLTFAVLGVMSANLGVPISEVVSSGTGMAFVTYPEALAKLPLPQFWSFIFFLMLLTLGLDSQFMSAEIVSTVLMDRFPHALKGKRPLIMFLICLVGFLLGIVFCTQGGQYLLQFMDWYSCSLAFFVVCFMEVFCLAWIYGIGQFNKDIVMMLGRPIPRILQITWCYISPCLLLTIFVLTMQRYSPPTYGKYRYPDYAGDLGWLLAALPVVPIPVFMVIELLKHKDASSFKERVLMSLRPEPVWQPASKEYREEHSLMLKKRRSLSGRFTDPFCSQP